MRLGLRSQILVSLTLLMVATMLLVSLAMLGLIQNNMERQAEHTAERVARIAATTMASAIDRDEPLDSAWNRVNLERLCALFSGQFEATRMAVVATPTAGSPLVVLASYPLGATVRVDAVEFLVPQAEGSVMLHMASGVDGIRQVEVFAPVVLDGTTVAVLRFQQPLGDLQRLVGASQQLVMLYVFLDAILIIVVGFFVLTRLIVRPVLAISAATDRVAAGDLDSTVAIQARNELGALAENFDRMVQRLRAGRDALEGRVEELRRSKEALERAQDEVLFSEKMATVGGLAAGVAHEIGNPLAAVMGLLDLMSDPDAFGPDELKDLFARAERELNRINVIIGELLDYSRVSESGAERVAIVEPVASAAALCGHHPRGRALTVTYDEHADVPEVFASSSRLVQVVLNLLLNAADATDGGRATVRWTPVEHEGEPGVRIDVADNGPGLRDVNTARLFEPFFTTKGPGKGTGLGLAICARIVGQYRGRIWATDRTPDDDNPGETGAVFHVWLPSPPAVDPSVPDHA